MPNRSEEAMSKGAGKVKAAAARAKGLKGVFNHLAEEHAEASSLLKQLMASNDAPKQQELWTKLRLELLSHERAELSEVYPALQGQDGLDNIVARHREEAEELEGTIQLVDQAEFGTESAREQLEALEQLVSQHVDEEENDFFPAAQEVLDDETIRNLKPHFEQAKKSIMGKL